MKRQFVSDAGVYSAAWKSKKAEDLVALVKRYEHALLCDAEDLPAKTLSAKIEKLCSKLDKKFPRTMPLLVEHSRHVLYGGKQSKISVKPARRDGGFNDSYWVILTLIDVKTDFDLSNDPVKRESLLVNLLDEKGGEA